MATRAGGDPDRRKRKPSETSSSRHGEALRKERGKGWKERRERKGRCAQQTDVKEKGNRKEE